MKIMSETRPILALLFCLLCSQVALSQQWQLDSSTSPSVEVTGTSTLTDWTVTCADVQEVPNELTFDPNNPGQIQDFSFKVPVEGMDGGRGASMNDKILEAFKVTDHPYIQYQQTLPASINGSEEANTYSINSTGTLTMAGVSKSVTVECSAKVDGDKLIVSGFKSINMSDYDMTPPSAMFGQIKTGDEVVVNYEFQYVKK